MNRAIAKKKSFTAPAGLLAVTLILLCYGLIVLYSASTVQSFNAFGTTTHYILHQFLYGGLLGLVAMYICSKLDYHIWQKYLPLLIGTSLLLLIAVKIPGLGFSTGGAARWIHLGPILFQPSEIAKLVIIFYLAAWVDRKQTLLNDFYFGILPSLAIIALFAGFILWQPDFGTMLVLIFVSASMLFVAGIDWKYFFWTIVAGGLALYGFILVEPYRARRLTTFLDPTIDKLGISYQINQAILAIGSGGLWGYGYGMSRQKYNFLPEASTDSIFAVMAEELGFFRVVFLLILFVLFALLGFRIAKNAPDMFGKMAAVGITSWIVLQAFVNIGAMVNILPLTGIPLPFFSYGSTSLLMTLAAIGILFNISNQSRAS